MAYDYYELLAQARQWTEKALSEGRLNKDSAEVFLTLDERSPEKLFTTDREHLSDRPLIVAFMGGTGVGKSSLLNRLAGEPIARAGVQRPTSREVTLYHHQAVSLKHLPEGLPLASVKVSRHNDAANSHIVWMDMPDFDSIELGNQHMVLQWLPHIDVLLYVVSPERYRDNKAWQLLLAEGSKHAWLFVMNQWDRGLPVQYEDFIKQLQQAGFAQPLVFRTSCSEIQGDEFPALLQQLQALSEQQSFARLEQRNLQLRNQRLKQSLQAMLDELQICDFSQLQTFYADLWQKTEISLQQGLAWPLQQLSKLLAEHPAQKPEVKLWDEWAQSRFNDLLDDLVLQASQLGIANKPLKTGLQLIKAQMGKEINQQTELIGCEAMLNPGNATQRFLLRLTGVCETLLPLLAMVVVGYQVFFGYYRSATEESAYLGVDFAVHSVLLIALSWLLPFFLYKKIQPSLQKAALKGLQKGLQQALIALDVKIQALLKAEETANQLLQQELSALIASCQPPVASKIEKDSLLGRVLVEV